MTLFGKYSQSNCYVFRLLRIFFLLFVVVFLTNSFVPSITFDEGLQLVEQLEQSEEEKEGEQQEKEENKEENTEETDDYVHFFRRRAIETVYKNRALRDRSDVLSCMSMDVITPPPELA